VDACFGLAKAYESLGKLSKAEEACRQAIAIRPGSINSQSILGAFLFNHGRYAEAEEAYRKVIELVPDSARGHFNLAAAHWMLGDSESAIAHYHRSLAIRPEASAYSSLGAVHYFHGNFVEAAAMFEKGVALKPNLPRTWGNLGDAYRWMPGMETRSSEAFDRAIQLTLESLALNPRQPEALAWMAEWLAKRGRNAEASRALARALRYDPENLNCMVRAVIVNHLAGRHTRALEWVEVCLTRGYSRIEFDQDPELAGLRADPRYPVGTKSKSYSSGGR
jgi:serine/threonine-protein kinase